MNRPAGHTADVTAGVRRPHTGFPFLDAGRESGAVLAFAHRGGARHPEIAGLENTLVAFEHAVALGYSYLETDVHATRDGVLLAFHDAVLDRVTSGAGSILEAAYVDLRSTLIKGREPIPRMADLLEHFPDTRFNIDIKSDAAVEVLAELVEQHRLSRPGLRRIVLRAAAARLPPRSLAAGRDVVRAVGRRARPVRTSANGAAGARRTRRRVPGARLALRGADRDAVPSSSARIARDTRSTSGRSTSPRRWSGCSTSASTG